VGSVDVIIFSVVFIGFLVVDSFNVVVGNAVFMASIIFSDVVGISVVVSVDVFDVVGISVVVDVVGISVVDVDVVGIVVVAAVPEDGIL